MKQSDVTMKTIMEPPEKVLKMYEAVMSFLQEERDMGSLKVSDITTRAGIGKGTAYEYFSSKEELITSAVMWGIAAKIHELADAVNEKKGFRDKCFCIFDWLEAYREYGHMMLRIIRGSFGECCCQEPEQIAGDFGQSVQKFVFARIDELLELGYEEGILTMQDKEKWALAFFGAFIQYSFAIMRPKKPPFLTMNQAELKEFIYDSMIKALN